MVTIVVISDIRLYRESLAEILDGKDAVSVSGTAANVEQAITTINHDSPDVVLIDMAMIDSCKAVDRIMSICPNSNIVALSMTDNEDSVLACAKAGIAGYVSRDASLDQLLSTVCGVVKGELYCPRQIAASLFHKIKSLQDLGEKPLSTKAVNLNDMKMPLLTQRERQIAVLVSAGLSNKQIARQLTIEVSTVKNHVHNILSKMGVHNRSQAVDLLQQQILSD